MISSHSSYADLGKWTVFEKLTQFGIISDLGSARKDDLAHGRSNTHGEQLTALPEQVLENI